eukprot:m.198086 g.198086  ORF g.198086 m.198086 type:complete len:92 (-) comp15289_c0_seq2:4187-4462(-)
MDCPKTTLTGFDRPNCVRRDQLMVSHPHKKFHHYVVELQNLTANDNNRSIVVQVGGSTAYSPGVVTKARAVNETGMILLKLEKGRHFDGVP